MRWALLLLVATVAKNATAESLPVFSELEWRLSVRQRVAQRIVPQACLDKIDVDPKHLALAQCYASISMFGEAWALYSDAGDPRATALHDGFAFLRLPPGKFREAIVRSVVHTPQELAAGISVPRGIVRVVIVGSQGLTTDISISADVAWNVYEATVDAPAQDDGSRARAIALARQGLEDVRRDRLEVGCAAFSASFTALEHPYTDLNLAECERARGDIVAAWGRYQDALQRSSRAALSDADRARAQLAQARLRNQIARVQFDVGAQPRNTSVDGGYWGPSRHYLTLGTHDVVVKGDTTHNDRKLKLVVTDPQRDLLVSAQPLPNTALDQTPFAFRVAGSSFYSGRFLNSAGGAGGGVATVIGLPSVLRTPQLSMRLTTGGDAQFGSWNRGESSQHFLFTYGFAVGLRTQIGIPYGVALTANWLPSVVVAGKEAQLTPAVFQIDAALTVGPLAALGAAYRLYDRGGDTVNLQMVQIFLEVAPKFPGTEDLREFLTND